MGFDRDVEKKFDLMLAGDLDDLPHLPRSIVRIFLSSTFSGARLAVGFFVCRVPFLESAFVAALSSSQSL